MAKKIKVVEKEEEVVLPKEEVVLPKEEIVLPIKVEIKTYLGKKIISEKTSVINEKNYISITLEDGSICQLSESEYNNFIK